MADSNILNYHLSLEEQEMIVNASRASDTVTVYCSDRTMMTKLDKMCKKYPETYRLTASDPQVIGDGKPVSKTYEAPKKLLRFAPPRSEKQKALSQSLGKKYGEKNMRRLQDLQRNTGAASGSEDDGKQQR